MQSYKLLYITPRPIFYLGRCGSLFVHVQWVTLHNKFNFYQGNVVINYSCTKIEWPSRVLAHVRSVRHKVIVAAEISAAASAAIPPGFTMH